MKLTQTHFIAQHTADTIFAQGYQPIQSTNLIVMHFANNKIWSRIVLDEFHFFSLVCDIFLLRNLFWLAICQFKLPKNDNQKR